MIELTTDNENEPNKVNNIISKTYQFWKKEIPRHELVTYIGNVLNTNPDKHTLYLLRTFYKDFVENNTHDRLQISSEAIRKDIDLAQIDARINLLGQEIRTYFLQAELTGTAPESNYYFVTPVTNPQGNQILAFATHFFSRVYAKDNPERVVEPFIHQGNTDKYGVWVSTSNLHYNPSQIS